MVQVFTIEGYHGVDPLGTEQHVLQGPQECTHNICLTEIEFRGQPKALKDVPNISLQNLWDLQGLSQGHP